jgi:hypothetical protein
MTDTSRVQRWREGKRKEGLKAVTVWLNGGRATPEGFSPPVALLPFSPGAASIGSVLVAYTTRYQYSNRYNTDTGAY